MTPVTDTRAIWLRSLGWRETAEGWTGQVIATKGRYKPMSLEDAFEVSLKRCVTDEQFRVEVRNGQVRLALPWQNEATADHPASAPWEPARNALARARQERPDALGRDEEAS